MGYFDSTTSPTPAPAVSGGGYFPVGFEGLGWLPIGYFSASVVAPAPITLDLSGSVIVPDAWDFSNSIIVED